MAQNKVPTSMLEDDIATQAEFDALKGLFATRNKIINGCCRVAQRGNVAAVNNALTYGGCDRIAVYPANFTTFSGTIQQVSNTGNNTASNCAQVLGGVTTTGLGAVHFVQRIEAANTVDLSGKTVTVSARVYHDVGSAVAVQMSLHRANAANNFAATTQVDVTKNPGSAATGVYTTLSAPFTLVAGDGNNGLMVFVSFTSLGALTTRNFYLGDLQLVVGSEAPAMDVRPITEELARCQRYYEKSYDTAVVPGSAVGAGQIVDRCNTTQHEHAVRFRVEKRTAPAMVAYNPNSGAAGSWRDNTGAADRTASFSNQGTTGCQITLAATVANNQIAGHWVAACEL